MRIHFIVNGIFPNKKAYGIQIAKMCEAFVEAGADLTLVIPHTRASVQNVKEFYGLRKEISVRVLPAIPLYHAGRIWFFLSSLSSMLSSTLYLWLQKLFGRGGVIYTVDLSTFSFANLVFCGLPVFIEVHDAKPYTIATKVFFLRATGVIVTNSEIRTHLLNQFKIPEQKCIVEQNSVDESWFTKEISRNDARSRVGIPLDRKVALYMGRFYAWKHLEILTEAAFLSSDIDWYVVGGSQEEFKKVANVTSLPSNLHIMGECSLVDVPLWLSGADALIVLGSLKTRQSSHFTTPMKIYEYMAMKRPVVASDTPALRSLIQEEAVFYTPDIPASLAEEVRKAIEGGAEIEHMVQKAYSAAKQHTWNKRAERILSFLSVQ
ncbi:glycosyltransferase family 4 protein [Acetobacteraceae bacterium]|nr:glycosyltransferase family 4 protein [Candidatus Parcubacteria bacterium]